MNNNVKNWLKMAEEDLLWAEASLKDGMLRGACFAAQQSAEKALKAFLLSKGKNIQIEDYSEETVKNVVEQSRKVITFVKSQIS